MIIGLALTTLIVNEYEEAIQFYCEKLGFTLVEDTQLEKKRWVRIAAPGKKGSEILLSRAEDEVQRTRIGNQTGGRVLFFMFTDDLDSDFKKLQSIGIDFTEAPLNHSYGKVAVFKDLYGNRIDLIEYANNPF